MLTIAILSLSLNLLLLTGGVYVTLKSRRLVAENIGIFEDYFTAKDESDNTAFTKLVSQVGNAIAYQVNESVTMAINGAIGGTMKGATAELEQRALDENPTLAIMQGMPKSIRKNPLAALAMQALLNKNLPANLGGTAAALGGGNGISQPKFNL